MVDRERQPTVLQPVLFTELKIRRHIGTRGAGLSQSFFPIFCLLLGSTLGSRKFPCAARRTPLQPQPLTLLPLRGCFPIMTSCSRLSGSLTFLTSEYRSGLQQAPVECHFPLKASLNPPWSLRSLKRRSSAPRIDRKSVQGHQKCAARSFEIVLLLACS